MHQRAPVHPVESGAAPLREPDLEADLARQTVEEGQALALPVVRAEEGLLELLLECVRVGQVERSQLARRLVDEDET